MMHNVGQEDPDLEKVRAFFPHEPGWGVGRLGDGIVWCMACYGPSALHREGDQWYVDDTRNFVVLGTNGHGAHLLFRDAKDAIMFKMHWG